MASIPGPPVDLSMETERLLEAFPANLENGEIPLKIFNDEEIHELELERIFARTWVFVGHESEIANPGDYALRYVSGDPFIFVRDEDGTVRLLFDSCRHRGTKLCRTEMGNTSHFRCPYHGWTFKNTGELVGVPKQEQGYPDLDKSEYGLYAAPKLESYDGFVFASLDPDAPTLREYLGGAAWYLDAHFKLADWEVIGEPQRWQVNIDWKTVSENASADSYHVPIGHKSAADVGIGSQGLEALQGGTDTTLIGGASDALTFGLYRVDHDEEVYWGYPQEVRTSFDLDAISDDQREELIRPAIASINNIFPNLSFNHTCSTNDPAKDPTGVFKLRQWQPIGPGQIEIWYWILAPSVATPAQKERIYDTGMGSNGISGGFFVDDLSILQGISETGGSVFARRNDLHTHHRMGMNEAGTARPIEDWPGPGDVLTDAAMTDVNNHNIYRNWYRWMCDADA